MKTFAQKAGTILLFILIISAPLLAQSDDTQAAIINGIVIYYTDNAHGITMIVLNPTADTVILKDVMTKLGYESGPWLKARLSDLEEGWEYKLVTKVRFNLKPRTGAVYRVKRPLKVGAPDESTYRHWRKRR